MSTPCCFKAVEHSGNATGTLKEIGGLETYVSGDLVKGSKILIYFSDIFGHPLINNRLIADSFAKNGYVTLIPDLFNKDPIPFPTPSGFAAMRETWTSNHPPDAVAPIITAFISEVRQLYSPEFVAATGYCFGARPLVDIVISRPELVDAAVLYHPSRVTKELIDAITDKVPIFVAAAEEDSAYTDEVRHYTEAHLKKIKARYVITVYSGTSHGFAVRGDLSNPSIKFGKEKSFKDALEWFDYFSKN